MASIQLTVLPYAKRFPVALPFLQLLRPRLEEMLLKNGSDIGVYLDRKASESTAREERRLLTDAALRYFDRALLAPTYDCRHYPHYHRGRILEQRGRFSEARDAYYTALQIEPGWEPAMSAWHRILGYLN